MDIESRFPLDKPSHLRAIVAKFVDSGASLSGMSVSEAAERTGFDVDLIPADLRDLRWPAEP